MTPLRLRFLLWAIAWPFWVVGLFGVEAGAKLNTMVTEANGGLMPVWVPDDWERAQFYEAKPPDAPYELMTEVHPVEMKAMGYVIRASERHVIADTRIHRLLWLCDWIVVSDGIASPGDLLIDAWKWAMPLSFGIYFLGWLLPVWMTGKLWVAEA